jgi:hypothetical protein
MKIAHRSKSEINDYEDITYYSYITYSWKNSLDYNRYNR